MTANARPEGIAAERSPAPSLRREVDHSTLPIFDSRSAAYRETLRQLDRFAACDDATVVLTGETGTGKSLLARRLHSLSPRSRQIFHLASVALFNESLAASELFGHVPGAFTDARQKRQGCFVTANGGTLFLDEIAKAPLGLQKMLLQALESGEIQPVGADRPIQVNVRVVVATNQPLEPLVRNGAFLPDLYSRLGAFRIVVPALRERREDIAALVAHFVARHATACGYDDPPPVSAELMQALVDDEWPYNLRQLDSTMHRILVDAEGARELTLDHCDGDLAGLRTNARIPRSEITPERAHEVWLELGKKTETAERLGVARTTLDRLLAKYERRRADSESDAPSAASV